MIKILLMLKNYLFFLLIVLGGAGLYFMIDEGKFTNPLAEDNETNTSAAISLEAPIVKTMKAKLQTNKGDIIVEFYSDDAPKTVANFVKLAKAGFYDGLSFHRVIPGFMIQGGDPNCGKSGGGDVGFCGGGGPGYKFDDELNPETKSYKEGYKKGVVAMANAGPNTNGSQFFIMVADVPLPHNYSIFGRVISGQEVADTISVVSRDAGDRPLQDVIIERVAVEE